VIVHKPPLAQPFQLRRLRQHTSAYVRICQHTSAYVSIRQTSRRSRASAPPPAPAYVSIRPHTSEYVSIRQTGRRSRSRFSSAACASYSYVRP
jgi:hypothetical protein